MDRRAGDRLAVDRLWTGLRRAISIPPRVKKEESLKEIL
jgi:hypothetical protein